MLADFQALSPSAYQKSKIDVYLRMFERAIHNLSELDDRLNDAIEIIKRQNLYTKALTVYRGKKTYPASVLEFYFVWIIGKIYLLVQ